ncbi:NAD(P)H-quinone oxidoreductase subunit J, chloroplastic [bioreactor metagenome]|uniref:NAD(P)H-quinone oxidoreductase subunit J, chloroplastic n=1 Tax=bioreactor metagenome TaxID=1076179 RepID=A0A645BJ10_9ZZZZ
MTSKDKKRTPQEILQAARDILQPWTISTSTPEENRLDVVIDPKNVKAATKAILDNKLGYLAAITGLDVPEYSIVESSNTKFPIPEKGQVEVLYHFCEGPVITSLRMLLPYDHAELDSICDILPSASLYERETMELLGVNFVGTPSTDRLLLPDNWPDGVYPLRKAFTGLPKEKEA